MEEPVQQEQDEQQERQDLEYNDPNEDQGDVRRRLRDRDLLKKRKAEAEEKETNQWDFGTENPRKRAQAGAKRGRRRGRPRKNEPPMFTVLSPETPAAVAVPVFSEVNQTPSCLTSLLETRPVPAGPALVSVFEPAPMNPTPDLVSPQAPVLVPRPDADTAPITIQAFSPDAVSAPPLLQVTDPASDPQMKPIYIEPQSKAALGQILIEDLGSDEEEDLCPSQVKRVDEDLSEKPLISAPEQNTLFSNPIMSTPAPPPEYVPGNSFELP